jgi:hypothetical protein
MGVSLKMMPKKNNLASPHENKYYPCALYNGEALYTPSGARL